MSNRCRIIRMCNQLLVNVQHVYGVRAWHIIHGVHWPVADLETSALLEAAKKQAPPTTKRKRREPITLDQINLLRPHLEVNSNLGAAVFACLTTTFFAAARLGEFTVKNLDSFNPDIHVKRSDIRQELDRHGNRSTVFHLPRTKVSDTGEEVSWSPQSPPLDPLAALEKHLQINNLPANAPLFAYKVENSTCKPLTRAKFLETINKAAKKANLPPFQGHSIRIGATLEYLLRGVPFEVMKVKGRWASDSFLIYLHRHAQILAPFMQEKPDLHAQLIAYTIPPLGRR